MNEKQGKLKAKDYYDQEAKDYIVQYRKDYGQYPANLIRIKFIIERLKRLNVKTVLDAGCGTCGPMIKLLNEGFDVKGLDFSKEMVEQGKLELQKAGYDPCLVQLADLESGLGLPGKKFDAVLALGVFPHIVDETKALRNARSFLNREGVVFIEFRNDLFSAYTLNKYSLDFFLNRAIDLKALPQKVRKDVVDFYAERFKVARPAQSRDGKIRYDEILAKFRNPLNVENELFKPCDFSVINIHFYHYHALPPIFENKYPRLFQEQSLKMEKTDDWRGYFMASALVLIPFMSAL